MQKNHDALRPGKKARAVHHVGTAVGQRPNHGGVVPGVVFKVSVLQEHVWIFSRRKAKPQRSAFAAIGGVKKTLHAWMAELAQKLRGAVGRSVVDDDDLLVEAAIQHALDYAADRRCFVVLRNHDRNFRLLDLLSLDSRCCPKDDDAQPDTPAPSRSPPILA